jgi:hypothetical protein
VLIPRHRQGYIDAKNFERIQRTMDEDIRAGPAPVRRRRASALLSGLLRCRWCRLDERRAVLLVTATVGLLHLLMAGSLPADHHARRR